MEWFAQGKNDGLCGFYAALNAISFLLNKAGQPLPFAKKQKFFDKAVDFLIEDEPLHGPSSLSILKGNSEQGGICQSRIAKLCQRIATDQGLSIEIEEAPRQCGRLNFQGFFDKVVQQGDNFAIIAATRGGGHWVVVAAGPRKDRFIIIDNAAPAVSNIGQNAAKYVTGESITLRLKLAQADYLAREVSR